VRSILVKTSAVAAVLAVTLAFAGTVGADHVTVNLSVPDQAAIGQPAQVRAEFHSDADGAPIAGMTVILHEEATIGGVTGDVELAAAVTDANGVATLTYTPRVPGDHALHVRYTYGDEAPQDASASVTVPPAAEQLYRSTSGVSIPGLNVWLIMAVVAIVWAILLSVAARVIAIAHADTSAPEAQMSEGQIGDK